MLEILKFIFSSFWVFIGTCMLLSIVGEAAANIIQAIWSPIKINISKHSDEDLL